MSGSSPSSQNTLRRVVFSVVSGVSGGWAEHVTGTLRPLLAPARNVLAVLVGPTLADNFFHPVAIGGYCAVVAACVPAAVNLYLRKTENKADKRLIAEQDAELAEWRDGRRVRG